MSLYSPPYQVTSAILKLVADISEILGELRSNQSGEVSPVLRKQNSIRTIQGSLAIEGNSLNLEQMTSIIDGKKVLGRKNEIIEVQNAVQAYAYLEKFNANASKSLLDAHRRLMNGLVSTPGYYRSGSVGILKGSKVSHIAPKARDVPRLMEQLFDYLKKSKDLDLIKSCVFHYELEFIHPFEDGNGRVGRLWQTLILTRFNAIFRWIPIESQIHAHQSEYYKVLETCDREGSSTAFIEWMLGIVLQALREFSEIYRPQNDTPEFRVESARAVFEKQQFSRADYMKIHKRISAPTASRDLAAAVRNGALIKSGDKRTTCYQFKAAGRKNGWSDRD
jgi:Fic family protein